MYQYVFYCWFLANVMHPVFYLLVSFLKGQSFSIRDMALGVIYFIPTCLISFFMTLPSLLMGWLVMGILMRVPCNVVQRFCLWLLSVILIVLTNLFCLIVVIKEPFSLAEIAELRIERVMIIFPAIISAILASILCFKRFDAAFNQTENQES